MTRYEIYKSRIDSANKWSTVANKRTQLNLTSGGHNGGSSKIFSERTFQIVCLVRDAESCTCSNENITRFYTWKNCAFLEIVYIKRD